MGMRASGHALLLFSPDQSILYINYSAPILSNLLDFLVFNAVFHNTYGNLKKQFLPKVVLNVHQHVLWFYWGGTKCLPEMECVQICAFFYFIFLRVPAGTLADALSLK